MNHRMTFLKSIWKFGRHGRTPDALFLSKSLARRAGEAMPSCERSSGKRASASILGIRPNDQIGLQSKLDSRNTSGRPSRSILSVSTHGIGKSASSLAEPVEPVR